MQIEPDPALVVLQVVPFLVTMVVLHHVIFKPMLAHLDQRASAVTSAKDDARRLEERLQELRTQWDARMAEARAEGMAHRTSLHEEASRERARLVAASREESDRAVAEALSDIDSLLQEARGTMERGARELAREMADALITPRTSGGQGAQT